MGVHGVAGFKMYDVAGFCGEDQVSAPHNWRRSGSNVASRFLFIMISHFAQAGLPGMAMLLFLVYHDLTLFSLEHFCLFRGDAQKSVVEGVVSTDCRNSRR